jgi:hypothetical protein
MSGSTAGQPSTKKGLSRTKTIKKEAELDIGTGQQESTAGEVVTKSGLSRTKTLKKEIILDEDIDFNPKGEPEPA